MREKQRNAWLLCLYAATFAAACVFILYKCRFGYASADEAFYLTIPLRLVRGDGLFAHEWHLSQMSSFLTLPILYVYMKLVGTTVGIVLAFRYIYSVVWIAGSLFVFFRLRKTSFWAAAAASLIVVLYAPFGVMALSYNSLGILNMMLCCVLLCTAKRFFAFFAAGVLFAAAVLCCPYLAAVYALYSLGLLIYGLRRRQALSAYWKKWLLFTVGVGALAVLFVAFVFSRASLSQILDALPLMLRDPEHRSRSVLSLLKGYVGAVAARSVGFKVFVPCAAAFLMIVWVLRRRTEAVARLYIWAWCGVLVWLVLIWTTARELNFFTFPMQLIALFTVLTLRDRAVRPWIVFGYVPALLYSFCIHISSNMAAFSISAALLAATPAVAVMTAYSFRHMPFAKDRTAMRRAAAGLAALALIVQIGMQCTLRYTFTFREASIDTLTAVIDNGPERGLRTTPEKKARYLQLYDEVRTAQETFGFRSVLYLSENTALCLMGEDVGIAAYSGWLSGVTDTTLERLDAYFALHPEKVPQAVFYDQDIETEKHSTASYAQVSDWVASRFGFGPQETASGDAWFVSGK